MILQSASVDPATPSHEVFGTGTTTTVSVNQLDIEVATLAKVLAEIADRMVRTTWESEVARDDTLGPPMIAEAMSWLPTSARLLFGRQSEGACQVLASVGPSYAQLTVYRDHADILVADDDADQAHELGRSIVDNVPGPRQPPDGVVLSVWSSGPDGPQLSTTSVAAPPWTAIERNYPGTTRDHLAQLMNHTPDHAIDGRLVLFHGPPGTGKTHAIRALMAEWQGWCDPELVVDPEHGLFEYSYLQRLLAPTHPRIRRRKDRWRLVVAEDADRVVRSHDRQGGAEPLDRLLNATDGILGQASKTIFLLTTNVPLTAIIPAITRHGRCMAALQFEEFRPSEAKQWLGDVAEAPSHGMTLAELFELKTGARSDHRSPRTPMGQYL